MASRRLPLSAIVAATALALVAALGVLALLDDGDADDAAAGDGTSEGYELTPAGELPGSVAEVRLGSLEGGEDRMLGELLGTTPVVVNFFGSWCAPCVEEMPAFERVHQALADQVGLRRHVEPRPPADALAIVESTGVTYPTFDDPDASALTYFGGLGMPTTVFIDAAGNVVDVHSGPMTEAELQGKIADLFGIAA